MRANYSRKLRFRVAHKCALRSGASFRPFLEKIKTVHLDGSNFLVGAKGFEPSTPWSQTKYSTRLSYTPKTSPIIYLFF